MWFLFASISAVFYSLLWVFARMSRGIPSTVVTAGQFILGPIFLLIVVPYVDFPWHERWWWMYLLVPFVMLPVLFWTMTYALHRTEVTLAKPLFGLSSVSTLLVSSIFFGEGISLNGIAGVLIITMGILFLYHGRWQEWRKCGPWIVLICAFGFGATASFGSAVLKVFPEPLALSALVIGGAFFMNAPTAASDVRHVRWSGRVFLILALMAVAATAQDIATVFALATGHPSYVIAVKRTSVLLTAVIGYVFLKERDQSLVRLLIASGLVVVGVVMLTI